MHLHRPQMAFLNQNEKFLDKMLLFFFQFHEHIFLQLRTD